EDRTGGPEPRPRRGPGRLAPRDPGAPQPGRVLPSHRTGFQPRRNLSDADHRDLGPLPGRRLPHGREAGLQRADRARHVRRARSDPERRGTRHPGEQSGVPDPVPVPRGRDARLPQGRETEPRDRGQLYRPVHATPPLGDRLQAGPLLREVRRRAFHLERHRGQDPGGGRVKLEFEMDTYKSETKPTWCPGCGDFAVLRSLQMAIHALQLEPWNLVIVSGIGCSSNLPHFLSTYGFHAIHGRALPVAGGVKLANPDLQVIVTGGDVYGYGIGVRHFIHAMRRNFDITYLVMNNQIYGLTTGQASPTSEKGMKTKSTPIEGVIENPVDPISLA